jgi:hypothetical protein
MIRFLAPFRRGILCVLRFNRLFAQVYYVSGNRVLLIFHLAGGNRSTQEKRK